MMDHEIADADRAHAALVIKPLQRAPGFRPQPRHGPMQEKEIDRFEAERRAALVERGKGTVEAVIGVPQLGRDEELSARKAAVAHRLADIGLIVVKSRRIDMAITELQRRGDRVPRLAAGGHEIDAEPDARHLQAIGELRRRGKLGGGFHAPLAPPASAACGAAARASLAVFAIAASAACPSGWMRPADMISLAASSGVIGSSITPSAGTKK